MKTRVSFKYPVNNYRVHPDTQLIPIFTEGSMPDVAVALDPHLKYQLLFPKLISLSVDQLCGSVLELLVSGVLFT